MLSRRVVLIDDDASSRELFRVLLGAHGFDIEDYDAADEALAAIEQAVPAAVVLDISLPGAINGYECARRLRAGDSTRHVLLVAVSGHAPAAVRAQGVAFDAVFRKPVEPDELATQLHMLLADRHV